jgi:hypothetical protein
MLSRGIIPSLLSKLYKINRSKNTLWTAPNLELHTGVTENEVDNPPSDVITVDSKRKITRPHPIRLHCPSCSDNPHTHFTVHNTHKAHSPHETALSRLILTANDRVSIVTKKESTLLCEGKGKGTVHPITGHESPEVE